jgi:hypothetical protein
MKNLKRICGLVPQMGWKIFYVFNRLVHNLFVGETEWCVKNYMLCGQAIMSSVLSGVAWVFIFLNIFLGCNCLDTVQI